MTRHWLQTLHKRAKLEKIENYEVFLKVYKITSKFLRITWRLTCTHEPMCTRETDVRNRRFAQKRNKLEETNRELNENVVCTGWGGFPIFLTVRWARNSYEGFLSCRKQRARRDACKNKKKSGTRQKQRINDRNEKKTNIKTKLCFPEALNCLCIDYVRTLFFV